MNEFTRLLNQWSSRLLGRRVRPQHQRRDVESESHRVVKGDRDYRHGAEGNAFQVNSEPEGSIHRDGDHRHEAEGDAFQVNGHSAKSEGPTDDGS